MKLAIVSMCSQEYFPLAAITIEQNKREYCALHGYDLHLEMVESTHYTVAGYDRMLYVLELMEENQETPWFWIMGVDTMIMNFTIKMEEFIDDNFDFIIAADIQGMNADSYLVKNSRNGRNFLKALLLSRDWYQKNGKYSDSTAITVYQQYQEWNGMIKVVPQKSFNSYDYLSYDEPGYHAGLPGQFTEGDFLIHWPGKTLEDRIRLATEALPKVIR